MNKRWDLLNTLLFISLLVGALSEGGCGGNASLASPGTLPISQPSVGDTRVAEDRIYVHARGRALRTNERRPLGFYFRKRDQRRAYDTAATPTPYSDIIMQPGDACGSNPPNLAASCFATTYADQGIDSSCGTINWTYDTSELPAGVTFAAAPTSTAVDGIAYEFFSVAANVPVGNYEYSVAGTCSNANYTGITPATGTFSLSIVSVSIVDETRTSQVSALSPTPGPLSDVVGNQQELQAQASPAAAQPFLSSPTWAIPFNGTDPTLAYVSSYSRQASSATTNSAVNLNANPLEFFPIAPASGQLTVTADSYAAGTAFHAAAGYTIVAPSVAVTAAYGSGNLGTCVCNSPVSENQVLIAGSVLENAPASPTPGIAWTATFSAASPLVSGIGGMTQLANLFLYTGPSPAPGATSPPGVFGGTNGYELDRNPQYPQTPPGIGSKVQVNTQPSI